MGLDLTCCSMANGQCLGTDKFGRDVRVYSDRHQGKTARVVAFKFHAPPPKKKPTGGVETN